MGLRGPAPKPTSLKLLAGNPGHRPLNRREPKPRGKLRKPKLEWFDRKERDEAECWKWLSSVMPPGVMTSAERNLCVRYCRLWARWIAAERRLDDPAQCDRETREEAAKLTVALLRIEQEMGLTPAARSRIQAPAEEKQSDPLAALQQQRMRLAQ